MKINGIRCLRRVKKRCALPLIFIALCALSAEFAFPEILPPTEKSPRDVPWKVGEKLSFDLYYGFVIAGQAFLEVRDTDGLSVPGNNGEKVQAYHIVAEAHSTPFVDVFYKVRDKNESWLDSGSWISHRFEQHNQEGKFILDQTVEFDWKNKRFKNLELVKGRAPKNEEGDLIIPAVDTLSCLYETRAKTFDVGDEFTLDVHSGRNWPLVVKVLRREKVKVPAGTFDCYVVEPFLRERGLFIQKGKKLQVWLTADDRKMPVKMTAEIFIGHVSAELVRIEGK